MQGESYSAEEQRVIAEITRLWTSTDKQNDQKANREAVLLQFFQTAEKYPFTALRQTVDRWIADSRWFPSAVKDLEDELRAAQDRVTPQIESKNDPWAKIRASSPREWSERLVKLYEEQHRDLTTTAGVDGLSLRARMDLQTQAMNMVRDNGNGSFGINGRPIWTPYQCLEKTRYA